MQICNSHCKLTTTSKTFLDQTLFKDEYFRVRLQYSFDVLGGSGTFVHVGLDSTNFFGWLNEESATSWCEYNSLLEVSHQWEASTSLYHTVSEADPVYKWGVPFTRDTSIRPQADAFRPMHSENKTFHRTVLELLVLEYWFTVTGG